MAAYFPRSDRNKLLASACGRSGGRCVRTTTAAFARSCTVDRRRQYATTTTNAAENMLRTSRFSSSAGSVKQKFDYLLVLDFEATCDKAPMIQPQEIIEFPCLKLNTKNMEIESTFHQYVQPRVHTQLTSFCTQLTGIIQDMVDGQPDIEVTLQMFQKWLTDEGVLKDGVQFAFVTCGDWDLNSMLPNQCEYFKLPVPPYMKSWINIKKPFVNVTHTWPQGLVHMMSIVDLQHQGRMHSGIDDCKNLAAVLKVLAERGCVFDITGQKD